MMMLMVMVKVELMRTSLLRFTLTLKIMIGREVVGNIGFYFKP